MTVTKKQIDAAVNGIKAIAECIREAKEIPSGHLYAMIMSHCSLESYNYAISTLKKAGLVQEKHHLLRWIEPKQ